MSLYGQSDCRLKPRFVGAGALLAVAMVAATPPGHAQDAAAYLTDALARTPAGFERWIERVDRAPCTVRRHEAALVLAEAQANGLFALLAEHRRFRERFAAYLDDPAGPGRTATVGASYRLWLLLQSVGLLVDHRQYDPRLPLEAAAAYAELSEALAARDTGVAETMLRAFWRWSGRVKAGEAERFAESAPAVFAALDRLDTVAGRIRRTAASICE
jgi:hypothetical protein